MKLVTNTFIVLKNLPNSLRGKWFTLDELSDYLRYGGANLVTTEIVLSAIQNDNIGIFQTNRYKNVRYYCYGHPGSNDPSDLDEKRKPHMLAIFFKDMPSREVKRALGVVSDDDEFVEALPPWRSSNVKDDTTQQPVPV